jgi:HSP20 family protein
MSLIRYEPVDILNRINQQLQNLYGTPAVLDDEESNVITGNWVPAVDIREDDNAYFLHADLPGVNPGDIDISMDNGMLTIRGEKKEEKEEEQAGYKRVERVRGSFYRRFSLPDNADPDNITARSEHGVLELVIPKKKAGKKTRVTVTS